MKQKKRCSKCGRRKLLDEFSRNKKGTYGRHHYCKKCHQAAAKKTRAKQVRDKEAARNHQLRIKYGMTPQDFADMVMYQENKCAICSNDFISRSKTFIDHDHKTGKVRALLCMACNTMLGNAKEDPAILQSAIIYLKNN